MAKFNQSFPNLFGSVDKDRNSEEGEEGDNGNDSDNQEFSQKWGWISNVQSVADTMHKSWDDVFAMNVVEFLNVICFIKDKAEKDKADLEKWRRSH